MVTLIIGKLPPEISEENVRRRLAKIAEIQDVTLVREGDPDKVTAVINFNADRAVGDYLARRIQGLYIRGRRLTAHVSLPFNTFET